MLKRALFDSEQEGASGDDAEMRISAKASHPGILFRYRTFCCGGNVQGVHILQTL